MGAELNAAAISHLEEISKKGIEDMAASGTVAIMLPTTAYIMKLKPPPVRQLIEAGVSVALGSDFNPNAHCLAMVSHGNTRYQHFSRSLEVGLHSQI
jgi:imidazolonepropionase